MRGGQKEGRNGQNWVYMLGGALSKIIFAHVGVVGVDMSLLDLLKNTIEVVKGLL